MGTQTVCLAVVACIAAGSLCLQGCGGDSSGGGAKLSGTTQSGVNVFRGQFAGDPIASTDLPTGDNVNQVHMSSMVAFSSEDASTDMSKSLGIDISGEQNAFSGSVALQRIREAIHDTSSMHFEGETFVTMILSTTYISASKMLTLSPALSQAIKALPLSSSKDDDLEQYATFFNIHGSHFLSKVHLGGKLRLSFKADMQMEQSKVTDDIKSSFNLGAKGTFQKMIKLPISIDGHVNASDDDMSTFSKYSSYSQSDLESIGGDSTDLTWDSWKDTVKNNLAPVEHEYSGMDLILRELQATEHWTDAELQARITALLDALQSVLDACPGQQAVCSGQGYCDFASKSCKCDLGKTGTNCSDVTCPNSCGDHGSCDTTKGQCKCDDGWDHDDPSDPTTACSTRNCGDQKVCDGQCISPDEDCCDGGRTCPAGRKCCGDSCCDFCESGGNTCPQDTPNCCDSACGEGHTTPGLCCSDDSPCSQWPLCHCAIIDTTTPSRPIVTV